MGIPHVSTESTRVSLSPVRAGKEIYVLCFEWMDLSCELLHQLRSTHHCRAKKASGFKECPISIRDVQLAEACSARVQTDMDTPGQQDNVGQTGHVPGQAKRWLFLGECLLQQTLMFFKIWGYFFFLTSPLFI